MARRTEIRSYDYVNQPYERVREALETDALEVFRSATRAAASRARSLASELHVNVGGLEVSAPIEIRVGEVEHVAGASPRTRVPIAWRAEERPHLFPFMDADLALYPLTATETQLDFSGRYEPPLGALGSAIDKVVGHRIAEASVHRFVADVARHLRDTIGRAAAEKPESRNG